MRIGKIGRDRERLSEERDRLIEGALPDHQEAKIVQRFDRIRRELGPPSIVTSSILELPERHQGVAKIDMRLGKTRVDPERHAKLTGGIGEPALRAEHIRQVVVAICVVRREV